MRCAGAAADPGLKKTLAPGQRCVEGQWQDGLPEQMRRGAGRGRTAEDGGVGKRDGLVRLEVEDGDEDGNEDEAAANAGAWGFGRYEQEAVG